MANNLLYCCKLLKDIVQDYGIIFDNENDKWLIKIRMDFIEINYCPFCGIKLK